MKTETKFYNFNQNNSGGYFVEDDNRGICEEIIIEALSAKEAIEKLKTIGETMDSFWSYCRCCGERWSTLIDDEDGTIEPMICETPVDQVKKELFRSKCSVHYADGSFKNITFEQ